MSQELEISPLIQTKFHRPRLTGELIERTHLLERLDARRHRALTLVAAPAGYGKTMLVSQWLDQAPYPAAWLSLDENDNDLVEFLSYFVAAIRTLFPTGCPITQKLLTRPQIPPLDSLAKTLINEITALPEPFLLVLDDYHLIDRQDIHRLISALLRHAPPPLHLVITARQDPPFSLARPRAAGTIAEIRLNDLRFSPEEVQQYIKLYLGAEVCPEIVPVLVERTEGWAVGLRLACLSLRDKEDHTAFLETFQGTDRYIMEYLVDEILAHQPQSVQTFLLGTSFLDRFCAALGDAVLAAMPSEISGGPAQLSGAEILRQLERENLFLVALDDQGAWFRYHHLFQDLLWHKLKAETTPAQRVPLHIAASRWLDQHDFVEEALRHYFAANDTAAAAHLVARRRYMMMNRTQWQRLEQRLSQFSPAVLDQYPVLLMLKTWLIYHRAQWAELPAALQRVDAALAQAALTPEEITHLQGEMSVLRSLLSYFAVDPQNTLTHARQAIEKTPPRLWIVRSLARLLLAVALQMMGDTGQAYAAIYRGFEEEETQSNHFKATLLVTVCHIHWLTANLPGMAEAARECIKLSQQANVPQMLNWGHFHLGRVCYQQNDLIAAARHFAAVVEQPYLSYGDCYAHSACGLALTYQVQGRPDEARAVLEAAGAFMLETGNTTMMPLIQAFQAEIALRQGQLAEAGRWASLLDPMPPLQPVYGFFSPHLTLVKIWLAQDTPASRHQAADLLANVRVFFETTHNPCFLIDALALQALLNDGQGERQAALALLEQALTLAQPGGFIRLFVDLGPPLARLLARLSSRNGRGQHYVSQILTAFKDEKDNIQANRSAFTPALRAGASVPQPLIEPLTHRELDILELLAQRLSNQEIAERLFISLYTVKTHNRNIFAKLNVKNRRQAIARARELGLIASE